jgi:hypothetical protein
MSLWGCDDVIELMTTTSISGSGDDPVERRGKFYRLLELSRPTSFPRHGKLSMKQVGRILDRRSGGAASLRERTAARQKRARNVEVLAGPTTSS